MRRRARAVVLSLTLGLTACSAGAGLQVLSSPEDKIRAERTAHTFLQTLPFKYLGRSYTLDIMGDDRAAAWNVAPGIIYISQRAARHASDDELAQLIAHTLGHDLLAHPLIRTDVSDSRFAVELTTIAVVPGGLLLGGIVEAMSGNTDFTIAEEIEAEKIGLRLWLRSGRGCASWTALRRDQKERKDSWHEPIKDVFPPFEDLTAMVEKECTGRE